MTSSFDLSYDSCIILSQPGNGAMTACRLGPTLILHASCARESAFRFSISYRFRASVFSRRKVVVPCLLGLCLSKTSELAIADFEIFRAVRTIEGPELYATGALL